jgi:hypothetical protein
MAQTPVPVSGIHLVRLGDYVIVKAEIDGQWVEVIREHHDGPFSHIVEPLGMRRRQADAAVGQTNYGVRQ